jgi:hypothetical protein
LVRPATKQKSLSLQKSTLININNFTTQKVKSKMSQSAVVPACPPGFDCAFLNSCPQYYVDCPDGYFCDSYQGFPGQGKMDMKYAMYTQMNSDATVTEKNKERYIDKNRAIQVKCLFGFFCSSYDEMEVSVFVRDLSIHSLKSYDITNSGLSLGSLVL